MGAPGQDRMRPASTVLKQGLVKLLFASVALGCMARAAAAAASENTFRIKFAPELLASLPPSKPSQQQIPRQANQQSGALEGTLRDADHRPIGGATVKLRNLDTGKIQQTTSDGQGIFRLLNLPAGRYELSVESAGYNPLPKTEIEVGKGEIVIRDLTLEAVAAAPPSPENLPQVPTATPGAPETQSPPALYYPQLAPRPDLKNGETVPPQPPLPPSDQVFQTFPDRWDVNMPDWDRYGHGGEYPYVKHHAWDPFDRNKLKGDIPIIGQQTFLNITGVSDTFVDGRCLPTPTQASHANPGTAQFFGRCEQAFLDQQFRFTFDLFHGDTSFRPVDWRIRITPVVDINFLAVRELGIVNVDTSKGLTRLDDHTGLQEAFGEVKLADLSPNYDFISLRAGIQEFNSDFRGFLFVDEQPGARLFGSLNSNRWQYNLAYFYMLEKDTNSGLNTFQQRHQQVVVANWFMQDFFFPGYTAQFSVHYNKDDATIHYDDNGFLVRPAPIGVVTPHSIRAAYLGWTGDGHIGSVNVTHAFYQALGTDSLNPIAGRPVTINAQMAALELSKDKDWARFKTSVFYASGSANPQSGRARGFDAIEDFPEFAGGIFSLWNREGIRLTGTGVQLTPPNSLLPSLRSSKDEGQANFVNPGIFLANAGTDLSVTPKSTVFVNVNYLRFEDTESLEILLFQAPIRHSIGVDSSLGVKYRPLLSDNIVLTGGVAALLPGQGFKDIYTGHTLYSVFGDLRFRF